LSKRFLALVSIICCEYGDFETNLSLVWTSYLDVCLTVLYACAARATVLCRVMPYKRYYSRLR
jgi:hypothetical protein